MAVYTGTDKVDLLETREYGNRYLIAATQKILDRLDSENRTFAKITTKNRLEKERVNSIAFKVFELSPSFTVVTFPFEEAFTSPNGKLNGKINSLLDVFKTNPIVTIPDLTEFTGKSQKTISREFREYQNAGLLRREGSRKIERCVVELKAVFTKY